MVIVLIVSVAVASACLGYATGFHYGVHFLSSPKATPGLPLIKAFKGASQKRKPKFISEEEQWKREQKIPPRDPS